MSEHLSERIPEQQSSAFSIQLGSSSDYKDETGYRAKAALWATIGTVVLEAKG